MGGLEKANSFLGGGWQGDGPGELQEAGVGGGNAEEGLVHPVAGPGPRWVPKQGLRRCCL